MHAYFLQTLRSFQLTFEAKNTCFVTLGYALVSGLYLRWGLVNLSFVLWNSWPWDIPFGYHEGDSGITFSGARCSILLVSGIKENTKSKCRQRKKLKPRANTVNLAFKLGSPSDFIINILPEPNLKLHSMWNCISREDNTHKRVQGNQVFVYKSCWV